MVSIKEAEYRDLAGNHHKPDEASKENTEKSAAFKSVLLHKHADSLQRYISNIENVPSSIDEAVLKSLLYIS